MQQRITLGLEKCAPGQELDFLLDALRPNYNQMWASCSAVKRDLLLSLVQAFPQTRLEVFGSTVMGVAFKGMRPFLFFFFDRFHYHLKIC